MSVSEWLTVTKQKLEKVQVTLLRGLKDEGGCWGRNRASPGTTSPRGFERTTGWHSLLPYLQATGLQGKQIPRPGQGISLTRAQDAL